MFQSMKKNATKNVLEELLPLYFIIVLYKISCLHLWINSVWYSVQLWSELVRSTLCAWL